MWWLYFKRKFMETLLAYKSALKKCFGNLNKKKFVRVYFKQLLWVVQLRWDNN